MKVGLIKKWMITLDVGTQLKESSRQQTSLCRAAWVRPYLVVRLSGKIH
jgi:hypothetical protein